MELGAALVRHAADSSFRIVPVLIDDVALPSLLKGILYLDASRLSFFEVADRIASAVRTRENVRAPEGLTEWTVLLQIIEEDQFADNPVAGEYGGWSRSYAANYLPVAFPKTKPESVSNVDSVSVTHWVIRGLRALQRILSSHPRTDEALSRIERLLAQARTYLHHHFDGIGAGVMRYTSQGEQLRRDPRHSATFVKALWTFSDERLEDLRGAAAYALTRFHEESDGRLPSLGEIYHLIGLVESHVQLREQHVSQYLLGRMRSEIETRLKRAAFESVGRNGSVQLLHEPSQPHMSAYYTWWVLDACGEMLFSSGDDQLRALAKRLVVGLRSLAQESSGGGEGFPFTMGGLPDLGATAQIADVLLRLGEHHMAEDFKKIREFVFAQLGSPSISEYPHRYFLWAVPVFAERLMLLERGEQSFAV
jgi:hypothetical protein